MSGMREDVWELDWEGERRSTIVHLPPSLAEGKQVPLVLAFHGRNIDAAAMVELSGLSEAGQAHGFAVAYPNGRVDHTGGRYWSVNYTPEAVVTGSIELGFVDAVLDQLLARYPIDPARIVATGFSNGGILTYALARWRTDRFCAACGVAGLADFGVFTLDRPISLMHIHGTRDRFVPYAGGKTARKDVPIDFPPVPDMLARWLDATGCHQLESHETVPDPSDSSLSVSFENYGPGPSGSMIRVVTVEGGGHTWPGRRPLVSYLGKWTTAISGSELIAGLVPQKS